MKRLAIASLFAVTSIASISAVAFAKGGHIMDNGKTMTIDCKDSPAVMVMGNENTVTLTGTCTDVSVTGNKNTVTGAAASQVSTTGNDNTVTIDTVDRITSTGNRNTIAYKKSAAGSDTKVSNTGKDNKITKTNPPDSTITPTK